MKNNIIIFVVLVALISGCAEKNQNNFEFQLNYVSPFSQEKIPEVEAAVEAVASKWNLKVLKKSKWEATQSSEGEDAFGIFLSAKEKSFTVFIGNIGTPKTLVLGVVEDKEVNLSKDQVLELAEELLASLKKMGIEMQQK